MPAATNTGKSDGPRIPPAGADVRGYIEDRLQELAELATARGEHRIAVALQMAALDCARTKQGE